MAKIKTPFSFIKNAVFIASFRRLSAEDEDENDGSGQKTPRKKFRYMTYQIWCRIINTIIYFVCLGSDLISLWRQSLEIKLLYFFI
jgi:hypothetical protein